MNRPCIGRSGTARSAAILAVVGAACLTRPVQTQNPNEKVVFTTQVQNTTIDKIDLLFMIDNSASMGDKQALLAAAVPDMIQRLVTPRCLARAVVTGRADTNGNCPTGGTPEFPPVHDMHIAIVTSSIGSLFPSNPPHYLEGNTNECDPAATNPPGSILPPPHADDRGELINRGGDGEAPVPNANPFHFLAWFPPASQVPANAGKPAPPVPAETQVGAAGQAGTLIGDFTTMIQGVHEHGCGFEAQNEAWYRFLIQPDPYDHLEVNGLEESEVGIDAVILRQRAAFLRPDSLVAIIAVTDETEDHYDPLALHGEGWLYEQFPFPGTVTGSDGHPQGAAEGTIECTQLADPNNPTATGPFGPNCVSCALESVRMDMASFPSRCPDDHPNGAQGYLDETDDYINVRFFQPKRRFGAAPYYPISRYVRGLRSFTVPNRTREHDGQGNYVGDQDQYANCINPLYADSLPTDPSQELCALKRGTRTPDLVYYAAITGVPHQLLQVDGNNPDSPQKDVLTEADWLPILGRDPEHYDFGGADPHMLESEDPRATGCPPGSSDTCDPINGREYNPVQSAGQSGKPTPIDLQFACTFPLVDPLTGTPKPKDCTDPRYAQACDCTAGDPHQNSSLCQKDAAGNYTTTQIAGKAYPCLRELELARAMGDGGIVSSLCPIHPSPLGGPDDPLFGYRPAVNTIVNRLKTALSVACLPEKLTVDGAGQVPCLLLATMQKDAGARESDVCNRPGLTVPPADILARFVQQKITDWLHAGGPQSGLPDPSTVPVCQVTQIASTDPRYQSCLTGGSTTPPGWCYVEGQGADGGCPQEILFTQDQPPRGATVSLQCLEQVEGTDGGTL